ncbi:hypothetical protein GGS20DRAFT_597441 [Poronia punctata]|nr:hypothetical protein GGS20DRAFT_597441 [Poronia punctata]
MAANGSQVPGNAANIPANAANIPALVQNAMDQWPTYGVQLDSTSRVIRMTAECFHSLGAIGQGVFIGNCREAINEPAEFMLDGTDHGRIFLTSENLMKQHKPCRVEAVRAGNNGEEAPARRSDEDENGEKIKKTRNKFMLFRADGAPALRAATPGITNGEISNIMGERWRALTAEQQRPWVELADRLKAEHKAKYPHYKCRPNQNRKGKAATEASSAASETSSVASEAGSAAPKKGRGAAKKSGVTKRKTKASKATTAATQARVQNALERTAPANLNIVQPARAATVSPAPQQAPSPAQLDVPMQEAAPINPEGFQVPLSPENLMQEQPVPPPAPAGLHLDQFYGQQVQPHAAHPSVAPQQQIPANPPAQPEQLGPMREEDIFDFDMNGAEADPNAPSPSIVFQGLVFPAQADHRVVDPQVLNQQEANHVAASEGSDYEDDDSEGSYADCDYTEDNDVVLEGYEGQNAPQ